MSSLQPLAVSKHKCFQTWRPLHRLSQELLWQCFYGLDGGCPSWMSFMLPNQQQQNNNRKKHIISETRSFNHHRCHLPVLGELRMWIQWMVLGYHTWTLYWSRSSWCRQRGWQTATWSPRGHGHPSRHHRSTTFVKGKLSWKYDLLEKNDICIHTNNIKFILLLLLLSSLSWQGP